MSWRTFLQLALLIALGVIFNVWLQDQVTKVRIEDARQALQTPATGIHP